MDADGIRRSVLAMMGELRWAVDEYDRLHAEREALLPRCACGCGAVVSAGREYFHGHRPASVAAEKAREGGRRRMAAKRAREGEAGRVARQEVNAVYYQANAERLRAAAIERRARMSPEERRANDAAANARRDPEAVLLNARAQKARRRRVAPFTAEALATVPVLLRDPCSYCPGAGGTIDHIVPVIAGGKSGVDNLTAACARCNSQKRAEPLLHYLLSVT